MQLRVGVVGAGLIGARRAREAAANSRSAVVAIADVNGEQARIEGAKYGARHYEAWRKIVNDPDIDVVVAATPNAFLEEIAVAALGAGKHVLIEKPMGRSLSEAERIYAAAQRSKGLLKIGFNHRYHPGISKARELLAEGHIGELINIRATYGHGGRPGYELEWRGNPELSGGGELTDQGVHVADLINWFAGTPTTAFAFTQTAVWPIAPLEDNAFGLFQFSNGAVASFHTSWTQWKNKFLFEVFGTGGALIIDGLGGSYGDETLSVMRRAPEGGPPALKTLTFEKGDDSWKLEWNSFVDAIVGNKAYTGTADDGLVAMRMLDGLYRSSRSGNAVDI
ncbi:MAG TPA: Gfo/Idh/MocA family oxidoreductase [Candidatus Rubrimentiphilum sp.]|nr:Gfo/Idh/MocA family oxidoreductase [Candidatus Rubrimentiphilum sp.]